MQASTIGKPVRPSHQAARRSRSTSPGCTPSPGRSPSTERARLRNSRSGWSSSFCMKWQCQRSRPAKARRSRANAGSPSGWLSGWMRASVAWCTQRIEIVPKVRCSLSRLQPVWAVSGLDSARR